MQIVPVINCTSVKCFRERATHASKFLSKNDWIHIDVGKRPFTKKNTSVCTKTVKKLSKKVNFEIHLMSKWNRKSFSAYINEPYKRIFIHSSVVDKDELFWALSESSKIKKEIGLVYVSGEQKYKKHPPFIKNVLVLAVHPGKSGQRFHPKAIETIKFLKKKFPNVTITIDGGMCPISLQTVKKAGAKRAVSGSFIWNNKNPNEAYRILKSFS